MIKNQDKYNLTVDFTPISIGLLRFFRQFEESTVALKDMGISESQIEEITSIFTDTNLYLILLTFAVSLVHVRKLFNYHF